MHGPGQLRQLAQLEREQDNIRAALRRAVDGGEEQEALVLALGMSWFWSLRDYHQEARGWYGAVAALGPDPYADDAPPAVPLLTGPLDAPLPMAPDMLAEARRQVRLHLLMTMFTGSMAMLGDVDATELGRRVLRTYTPDLPQAYRYPVVMRVFAAFLAGRMDELRPLLDDAVAGCRVHGTDGDLAFILQIRSRMLNDWVGGLEQAVADGAEALELFTRLGDRWGMSEALSAQGETAAKRGDYPLAVKSYRRAIDMVRDLGAPHEIPMLQVRLGEALFETDQVEGERLLREAMETVAWGSQSGDGAMFYGRLVLCALHVERGEFREALDQLDQLEISQHAFGPIVPEVFLAIVSCLRGWATAKGGDPQAGVELLREARRLINSVDSAASVFAEHMTVMLVLPAAGVLVALAQLDGDRRPARKAAVLLGAHHGLHGQIGSYLERRDRESTTRALRALLGDEAFDEALAEGGRLSLSEATAMLDEPGEF